MLRKTEGRPPNFHKKGWGRFAFLLRSNRLHRVKVECEGELGTHYQDLGNFVFQKFPDQGDRLVLFSNGDFETLEVVGLEHHPLENPIAFPKQKDWRKTYRTSVLTRRSI